MLVNWLVRMLLLGPPALLLVLAVPRLIAGGAALESAFPVPTYIAMNVPQAAGAYRRTAYLLEASGSGDGVDLVTRGRALALAGERAQAVPVLEAGVARAPASIAGWTDLAALESSLDVRAAARLLNTALVLGPYDFWAAPRRAALAVELWPELDSEGRSAALRQIREFWEEPWLRSRLLPLLQVPGAPELFQRAYAGDPDTLRAINRWTSNQKRSFQLPKKD